MSCVLASPCRPCPAVLQTVRAFISFAAFFLFCCVALRISLLLLLWKLIYGVCVEKEKKVWGERGTGLVGTRRQAKVRHSRGPSLMTMMLMSWNCFWYVARAYAGRRYPSPTQCPAHFQLRLLFVTHIRTHTQKDPSFCIQWQCIYNNHKNIWCREHGQKIVNAIRRA